MTNHRTAHALHRSVRPARRTAALAAAAALSLAALAGCSSDGSDGSDQGSPPVTTAATSAPSATSTAVADGEPTTTTAEDGSSPESTGTAEPMGTYAVGSTTIDLVDTSRGTPANGDAEATDQRDLPTTVWYPAEGEGSGAADESPTVAPDAAFLDGTYPIVVFSHGVTGKAEFYAADTSAWASAGYVVIAPDYPLSNADSPGGATIEDVGEQPADASFLLDAFTDPDNADPDVAEVAAHVDAERIGAVGHSLGAITSIGLTYGECCADDRIDAAVSLAGWVLPLKDQPSPDPAITDVPFLIIHGDADGTVAYSNGEDAFANVKVPRWFVTLPGGEHIPPFLAGFSGPQSAIVVTSTVHFLDAELKDDPEGITELEQGVADAGPDVATIESADA